MPEPEIYNPFPGLRPFDTSLHHLFFGREQQVKWLLELLHQQHFLTVLGPSGSGKSSLVRAGVVPTLQRGGDGQSWETVLCKPGHDLLENLATAFGELGVQHLSERVLEQASGFTDALADVGLGAGRNVLLVVDQFEELFRLQAGYSRQAEEAERCVDALLHAVSQRDVQIYVVLTMRAEFLGHCTAYPGLAEAINDADYLVPRMTGEQLRNAIELPVSAVGAQISDDLVARLLDDVGGDEDQLPVLQHAMMRTWEYWEGSGVDVPLDLHHYEAVGTVNGALSKHAEEIYTALPEGDTRHAAELVFKTLAGEVGSGGGRRPTPLRELAEIAGVEEQAVVRAAEQFRQPGRWFITPSIDSPLTADTMLDIAHESLVRLWDRAKQWSQQEQESSHLYQRLAGTAALYQEGRAGLYQDPDLGLALEWRERNRPTAAWARRYDPSFERAITFLEHSRKERDFKVEWREEEQRRKLQSSRRLAVMMGGVSMIFLAMMVFALDLYFDAEENRKTAIEQREFAEEERHNAERQQQIAVEQRELAEEERRNAERQQQIAVEQRELAEIERRNAERQQQIAVEQRELAERQQQIAVEQREVAEVERRNAERQQQIAVEQKRNADRLRLLSVARTLAIQATQVQPRNEHRQLVALLALQAYNFNRRNAGSALESDIYNALQVAHDEFVRGENVLRAHAGGVRAVAFAPNGEQLISGGEDGTLYRWSIGAGKVRDTTGSLFKLDRSSIRQLRFSSPGQLAIGTTSEGTWHWDGGHDSLPQPLSQGSHTTVGGLDYTQEGRLVAAGLDGTVRIWEEDGSPSQSLTTDAALGRLQALAVSPDHLAVAGDAGKIRILDPDNPQELTHELDVGKTRVSCLAFSPDGHYLVGGTQDGDLLVWKSVNWQGEPHRLIGHISAITGLEFQASGELLASSSLDRSVRVWSLDENASISIPQDDWVWGVTFSPDGRLLASAGADRTVRLWYADVGDLADEVEKHVKRNLTEAEWLDFVGEDVPYEITHESLPGGAP